MRIRNIAFLAAFAAVALAVQGWPAGASASSCGLPLGFSPSVEILSPNGGQVLDPGSVYGITWSAPGAATVRISLSLDGGQTFPLAVAEANADLAGYSWTVSDYGSDSARIRLEALDGCGRAWGSSVSQGDFAMNGSRRLLPEAVPVGLGMTGPVSGQSAVEAVELQAIAGAPAEAVSFVVSSLSGESLTVPAGSDDGLLWSAVWDSREIGNGDCSVLARAFDGYGRTVGESAAVGFSVENVIVPKIRLGMMDPAAGSSLGGTVRLTAMADGEADAVEFAVRPKFATAASDPAVTYGQLGNSRLHWAAGFDTRRYADGTYLVLARAYVGGVKAGESPEIEVIFSNPVADTLTVGILAPVAGARASGAVNLSAQTAAGGDSLEFVLTADAAAGQAAKPTVIRAIPDAAMSRWTALFESYTVPNGSYGLKAKAYIGGRLAGESVLVPLTVANSLTLVDIAMRYPSKDQSLAGTAELVAVTEEPIDAVEIMVLPADAPNGVRPAVFRAEHDGSGSVWTAAWETASELPGQYLFWAKAWHRGLAVGESAKVRAYVRGLGQGIGLFERGAPAEDPNVSGSYGRQEAIDATPTISVDFGLKTPEGAELLMPPGTLFKSPEVSAVYYYGRDGRRYAFPDAMTYRTWYADFSNVRTVSAAEVAAVPFGGLVTYRPGIRMVKIATDPKVYAVARNGTLRWIASEVAARRLYGTGWNRLIDDISDSLFFSYRIGDPILE